MTEVDQRLIPPLFPTAPGKTEGLLVWASLLISALKQERLNRDAYAEFKTGSLAYSATISYDQFYNILSFTTVNATGNATVNAKVHFPGLVAFIITNDATSGKVITFGTNFKSTGTLTGTASKTAVVLFVSNGSTLYEASRITGLS